MFMHETVSAINFMVIEMYQIYTTLTTSALLLLSNGLFGIIYYLKKCCDDI